MKHGLYEIMGVNDNTVRIVQDGLENTVSVYRATLAPSSRRYCDRAYREQQRKENSSAGEKSCLEINMEESHHKADSLYVVDQIVRHIGYRTQLKYVVRWYGYTKADDITKPLHHTSRCFIDAHWRRFDKQRRRKPLSGFN